MSRLAFDVSLLVLLLANQQFPSAQAGITCVKENGDPVDWFVLYKLPKVATLSNELISNGTAYLYWTSDMNTRNDYWLLSNVSILSASSLPGRTLSQFYSTSSSDPDRLLLMYNDEFPNGTTTFNLGHTKGVIAADAQLGFWMSHSIPRFPPSPLESKSYSYPPTGTVFGQTLICMTLQATQIDLIGSQMKYMSPFVYHWAIADNLKGKMRNLMDAAEGVRIKEPPWFQSLAFPSNNGFQFRSFAKTKQFGKDLYADWIAPALGTSLAVETWQNGEGKVMPSDCNGTFTTENIKAINVTLTVFKSHKDHSKWAVALDNKDPWICIGDINRMESQKKRGGGSVCFLHKPLWDRFHHGAAILESCPIFPGKSLGSVKELHNYLLVILIWPAVLCVW